MASSDFTGTAGYNEYYGAAYDAALNSGINPAVFTSLVGVESSWNSNAVSSAGAIGLAQVEPGTAESVNAKANLYDPSENLQTGATYLSQLLTKYGGDYTKALAAYNAGPGNIDDPTANPSAYSAGMQYASTVLSNAGVNSDGTANTTGNSVTTTTSPNTTSGSSASSNNSTDNNNLGIDFSKYFNKNTILAVGVGALCVVLIIVAALRLTNESGIKT